MSNQNYVLAIDFGARSIRAAVARLNPAAVISPQIVEFNNRRSLGNTICYQSDGQTIREVGEDIFEGDALDDESAHIVAALSPERLLADPLDQSASALLERLRHVALVNQPQDVATATWQTIFAAPAHWTRQDGETLQKRLLDLGFPQPQVRSSALASLAHYFLNLQQPGRYVVIDCGATSMRVAVCELFADGAKPKVLHSGQGTLGGHNFDKIIADLIRVRFPKIRPSIPADEALLTYFAENFKKQFSQAWAEGKNNYETRFSLFGLEEVFQLSVEEFQQQPQFTHLRQALEEPITRILSEAGCLPIDVQKVVLVGGGVLWPFVTSQVKNFFGEDRVLIDQYPEESVVLGATRLLSRPPQPESLKRPPLKVEPNTVFAMEMLGVAGFLGLGWLIKLGKVPRGCMSLVIWWGMLATAGLTLVGPILTTKQWGWAIVWFIIWWGVPILSGWLARKAAIQRNRLHHTTSIVRIGDNQHVQ